MVHAGTVPDPGPLGKGAWKKLINYRNVSECRVKAAGNPVQDAAAGLR